MTPFPLDGGRVGDGGEPRALRDQPRPSHAPGAVTRARRLRRESTLAERLLWTELRKLNANFRRQAPIGRYIADFVHHASKLVVEIDGPVHDTPEARVKDARRTEWLVQQGFRVIRFRDLDVINDFGSVVQAIEAAVNSPPSPALPPSRRKGA